jgi:hypothetical protein
MTNALDVSASRIAATLAFGEREANTLLDPRQGLVGINLGPRQRAAYQPCQPVGDRALGPMQTSQKYARYFAYSVGDHRGFLQLKLKLSAVQINGCGTSSSFSASGTSSSVGSPQWPSSMASASA